MDKNHTTTSTQHAEKKLKHGYRPRLGASLALLALLFLTTTNALAQTHTVTVNADTGGEWRYRFNGTGDWFPSNSTYYSGTQTITVNDGDRLNLQARNTDANT